jgi:hypothetical protein
VSAKLLTISLTHVRLYVYCAVRTTPTVRRDKHICGGNI